MNASLKKAAPLIGFALIFAALVIVASLVFSGFLIPVWVLISLMAITLVSLLIIVQWRRHQHKLVDQANQPLIDHNNQDQHSNLPPKHSVQWSGGPQQRIQELKNALADNNPQAAYALHQNLNSEIHPLLATHLSDSEQTQLAILTSTRGLSLIPNDEKLEQSNPVLLPFNPDSEAGQESNLQQLKNALKNNNKQVALALYQSLNLNSDQAELLSEVERMQLALYMNNPMPSDPWQQPPTASVNSNILQFHLDIIKPALESQNASTCRDMWSHWTPDIQHQVQNALNPDEQTLLQQLVSNKSAQEAPPPSNTHVQQQRSETNFKQQALHIIKGLLEKQSFKEAVDQWKKWEDNGEIQDHVFKCLSKENIELLACALAKDNVSKMKEEDRFWVLCTFEENYSEILQQHHHSVHNPPLQDLLKPTSSEELKAAEPKTGIFPQNSQDPIITHIQEYFNSSDDGAVQAAESLATQWHEQPLNQPIDATLQGFLTSTLRVFKKRTQEEGSSLTWQNVHQWTCNITQKHLTTITRRTGSAGLEPKHWLTADAFMILICKYRGSDALASRNPPSTPPPQLSL